MSGHTQTPDRRPDAALARMMALAVVSEDRPFHPSVALAVWADLMDRRGTPLPLARLTRLGHSAHLHDHTPAAVAAPDPDARPDTSLADMLTRRRLAVVPIIRDIIAARQRTVLGGGAA